jgi:hypothetical protein
MLVDHFDYLALEEKIFTYCHQGQGTIETAGQHDLAHCWQYLQLTDSSGTRGDVPSAMQIGSVIGVRIPTLLWTSSNTCPGESWSWSSDHGTSWKPCEVA